MGHVGLNSLGAATITEMTMLFSFEDGMIKNYKNSAFEINSMGKLTMGEIKNIQVTGNLLQYRNDPVFELCDDGSIGYNSQCLGAKPVRLEVVNY
ncbi:hypothetical protein METBIDRAFT_30989 [Metschnikowia bicuspidata var. bicuspidata NRRL YB-4993]|uniref:Uncharacterized protein n=1 Tax=Metschnikowia bicuspidata var. bicuspidata NRRL YB-4993 TaxID=869754 RepID=A0A1A0HD61_9ASCO|nr:hypothetical protein METBIDRAFT_30989 [Metschnikowia bicuspidata var. bicuspidata NRRL YB-4993]OBA22019.1 hypothetical protein METBIDRAFT_30989 [Metschnikowia bicuspidata var. bicuspidata NRRL YB-4993]